MGFRKLVGSEPVLEFFLTIVATVSGYRPAVVSADVRRM